MTPAVHHRTHLTRAFTAHGSMMEYSIAALLAAPDRDRKTLVTALAGLMETPRESLARRLIDLAPPRERALLREQLK